jgi:hypothetical protein
MNYAADASYTRAIACAEASGRNDLQSEKGTYYENVVTSRIYFTAAQSTCPGATKLYYDEYSVTRGTSLTFTASDAIVVLAPLPDGDSGMGGVLTLGCFDAVSGVFSPGPYIPIE